MKKFISSLLVFAMFLSLSSVASASEIQHEAPELLEEYAIDTGTYYTYSVNYWGETWYAIVFVPNDGRDVVFSATSIVTSGTGNQNEPDDRIYTVSLKPSLTSDAVDYLRDGFASLDKASVISATSFVPSEPVVERRDSIQADLFGAMREIYGNEYERIVYRNSTYPGIKEVKVYQDLVLRMNKKGARTFSAGTALSMVSLTLTKLTKINVTLSFLSTALSVATEYLDARKDVDAYVVKADFGRWTTIDDGSYVYTVTNKIYSHCGLNERSNETRAYLQGGNPEPLYIPSSSYYDRFYAQTNDAYNAYMNMKP